VSSRPADPRVEASASGYNVDPATNPLRPGKEGSPQQPPTAVRVARRIGIDRVPKDVSPSLRGYFNGRVEVALEEAVP
jgi:hypothetical protein